MGEEGGRGVYVEEMGGLSHQWGGNDVCNAVGG